MVSLALLAFAAGVLLLQLQPDLPAAPWLWSAPLCAALVGVAARLCPPGAARMRMLRVAALPLACLAGFAWAAALAHPRLAERLSPALEGRDIEVTGVVSSLPAVGARSVRFEFEIESAGPDGETLPRKVLLTWYRASRWSSPQTSSPQTPSPQVPSEWSFLDEAAAVLDDRARVHPGERWRFTVRLRRPRGNLNPHGFDYEAWLLERGIGATGYVRGGFARERAGQPRGEPGMLGRRDSASDRLEQVREAIRDRFRRVLGPETTAGILAALAVGDQRAIAAEEWRLFARTGVTHLMSISGLHVTLVSGMFAWLVGAGWRRVPRLALALPARKAAAAAAILAASGYTLLAGFAVPAQRTLYMVTIVALALWFGRVASPARVLALALGVVLAIDPWAVLAPGFWLSFGAVALIFHVSAGWSGTEPRAFQWLRIQWAITVGLAPAVMFLFAQVSLIGPLANAVAIPLVSALITPLALVAAVLPIDWLLQLADWLMRLLLAFLEWCSALPMAVWQRHVPPLWALLLALAGVAWMLLPRGVPSRWAGAVLLLPAFALPPPAPAHGESWITVLDVGQGLAVLVRTANHALLYDAGPMLGPDASSGERTVLPYLRSSGVMRLDMMIVTHNDTDHTGGAAAVLGSAQVAAFRSSLPDEHPLAAVAPGARPCERGERWEWDGVQFAILHPEASDHRAGARRNNLSCVLAVRTAGAAMLLTGDIERAAETLLLARLPEDALRAEVLLVPHHGSRTSSSAEFLAAVAPRIAVAAAGYRSRFGHPNREVLERYRAAGATLRRTDLEGAISVRLTPQGASAHGEREARPRYWRAGR